MPRTGRRAPLEPKVGFSVKVFLKPLMTNERLYRNVTLLRFHSFVMK